MGASASIAQAEISTGDKPEFGMHPREDNVAQDSTHDTSDDTNFSSTEEALNTQTATVVDPQPKVSKNEDLRNQWRQEIKFGYDVVDMLKKSFNNRSSEDEKELLKRVWTFSALYSQLPQNTSEKYRFCKREFGREMVRAGAVDVVCDICCELLAKARQSSGLSYTEDSTLSEALVSLLNMSDESLDVSERICGKEDVLENMAESAVYHDMNKWSHALNLVGTIYNCSRVASNKRRLRDVGFVWMLRRMLSVEDSIVLFLASVALAGILNEDESKLFQTNDRVIKVNLSLFENALKSPDHRFNGASSIELAEATSRLGASDYSKKILLDAGFLVPLQTLCQTGDSEEKAVALSAIWTLAFHPDTRRRIPTQEGLVDLLVALKGSSDAAVKSKASNVLWTIREELSSSQVLAFKKLGEKICRKVKDGKSSSPSQGHIMISYQWLVQRDTVFRLHETLERRGYRVWIDRQEMKGSMTEAMALAVENSEIFLMCISQNYKQSDNCRAEAEYAFLQKKHIVPVLLETNYVPDGWLGLVKGLKKHYDISDEAYFDVAFEDLLREIGVKGKGISGEKAPITAVTQQPVYTGPSGHGIAPVSDVQNWTQSRVREWLEETGCRGRSLQQLSGKQLLFLKKLKSEAPEFFYNFLEKRLKIVTVEEMTTFVEALTKLR